MLFKNVAIKRRTVAVLALLLADVALYAVGPWVFIAALGPVAARQPFFIYASALGLAIDVLVLAICDGRFDARLSKIFN